MGVFWGCIYRRVNGNRGELGCTYPKVEGNRGLLGCTYPRVEGNDVHISE